jgi:hypothetical protein
MAASGFAVAFVTYLTVRPLSGLDRGSTAGRYDRSEGVEGRAKCLLRDDLRVRVLDTVEGTKQQKAAAALGRPKKSAKLSRPNSEPD